ncbi:M28 family peptidase [Hydrogenophaga sp. 2FB]|uniref:M28 family peptidase n=1 Tax=Hydrogenophaga sp. 2FB TaxID=2502187 RepID=UPI0010F6326F|nr:M28 family peptidase [Hydrogenophaga sp. 2FB]
MNDSQRCQTPDALFERLEPERMMNTVRALCCMGEKVSGTAEELQACDWITGQLARYGVAWKVHAFDALISHPRHTALRWLGDVPRSIDAVGVAFSRETGPEGIEAELVWVGQGKPSDYDGRDVRGKIVLIGALPEYGACAAAWRAGAVGLLGASSGPQRHKMTCSPIWGSPASEDERRQIPDIAAASVNRPDFEVLRAGLADGPVRVNLVAEVETGWRTVQLPVAEIAGTSPQFLLAGAHYCTWFDGATDNVAADAILLELARVFADSRPQVGLRMAWWPGHSQGRYAGSTWYADQFWLELHQHCIGYLNIDINGSRGAVKKALRNVTAEAEAFAASAIDRALGRPGATDGTREMLKRPDRYADRRRPHRGSDQSFLGIGITSLQVSSFLLEDDPDRIAGGGLPRWWHAVEDRADMVDAGVLLEDARIHVGLVHGLLQASMLPFELEPIATDFDAALRELREAAPELALLDDLQRTVDTFRHAASGFRAARERLAPDMGNQAVLDVLRLLTPVLYATSSGFQPDRATSLRLLPGLTPVLSLHGMPHADRLQTGTLLRRAANRIAHALTGAADALTRVSSTISNSDA